MIKFLVMDVDGTLTDGKVYMGSEGELFKAFDIKDGCGIKLLLPQQGIIPVIITARKSVMLEHRCKELDICEIHQEVREKLKCLYAVLKKYSTKEIKYDLSNVAYIGDDIIDLQCMNSIKHAGGLIGCPANAVKSVIKICDFISEYKAGEGAVRDFVEYIMYTYSKSTKFKNISERINKAIEYIGKLDIENLTVGHYYVNDDFFYDVLEYQTIDDGECSFESHRRFVDIQWIVEGIERLYINDISHLLPAEEYNESKDVIHYKENDCPSSMILTKGSYAILFPKDAHKPGSVLGNKCKIKKIVGKVSIVYCT